MGIFFVMLSCHRQEGRGECYRKKKGRAKEIRGKKAELEGGRPRVTKNKNRQEGSKKGKASFVHDFYFLLSSGKGAGGDGGRGGDWNRGGRSEARRTRGDGDKEEGGELEGEGKENKGQRGFEPLLVSLVETD